MFRLIAAVLLIATTAFAAPLPDVPPLVPAAGFMLRGPAEARGALVWLHGAFSATDFPNGPPPVQDWVSRLAGRGYDIWRLNRAPRQDPLDAGTAKLLTGLAGLRAAHYRRVVVAGFSRGAFIGLAALAHPELADAVAAISPAAHGPRPERRPEALAAFARLMDAAQRSRLALVQLNDDPLDPGPEARAAAAQSAARRGDLTLLQVFRPSVPRGHMGSDEPEFDAYFGACIADFIDGIAGAGACDATSARLASSRR